MTQQKPQRDSWEQVVPAMLNKGVSWSVALCMPGEVLLLNDLSQVNFLGFFIFSNAQIQHLNAY